MRGFVFFVAIGFLFFITLSGHDLFAGNNGGTLESAFKVRDNTIVIRWAPTSFKVWEAGNQYGYNIEKVTVVSNGKMVSGSYRKLNNKPIKPQSEEVFGQYYNTTQDKFLAIAAQGIYGKDFQMVDKQNDIYSIVNKATENENRFAFALFSADRSMLVAQLSGLAHIDSSVNKTDKYAYRIYIDFPATFSGIRDTSYLFVDAKTATQYYMPRHLYAKFAYKAVRLQWPHGEYSMNFSGYFIERSFDGGKTWEKRNKEIFVPLSNDGTPPKDAIYNDTLPANEVAVNYRVYGVDFFGDNSASSITVAGMGISPVYTDPKITKVVESTNKSILVEWTFPDNELANIKCFYVFYASKLNGSYTKSKPLRHDTRLYELQSVRNSVYIKVAVQGKDSNFYYSPVVLFQKNDLTPPAAPVSVSGIVDSSGVAKLVWRANKEQDFLGYRVFRANALHEEFINISSKISSDTTFTDSLSVKTLTENVYYKILALDLRYNSSPFSTIIKLKKPDYIKPIAPLLTQTIATTTGIWVYWEPSSSKDVESHILYKRKEGELNWSQVFSFAGTGMVKSFFDSKKSDERKFQYALVAVDDAGLMSDLSNIKSATIIDFKITDIDLKPKVSADRESIQIVLTWELPKDTLDKVLIYRRKGDEPLTHYATAEGNTKKFTDEKVVINTTYEYKIKPVYKNGNSGTFSKKVKIDF